MNAPDTNYRITPQDYNEAWKILADREQYIALADEERNIVDAFMDAGHIHRATGVWPTVGEVLAHWNQENEERERKRIASWQDSGRITAYDFSCYEQQLAASDTDGPFVSFMRVAADLKKSSKQLTVGDVRAEIRKRDKPAP